MTKKLLATYLTLAAMLPAVALAEEPIKSCKELTSAGVNANVRNGEELYYGSGFEYESSMVEIPPLLYKYI